MKRTQWFALFILAILSMISLSSFAESRPAPATAASEKDGIDDGKKARRPEPIVIDGQIREVARDGDAYVFWLIRQKYPVIAWPSTRVRGQQGESLYVAELQPRDVIHVTGNLVWVGAPYGDTAEKPAYVIRADRIVLQLHVEHGP